MKQYKPSGENLVPVLAASPGLRYALHRQLTGEGEGREQQPRPAHQKHAL